MGPSDDRLARTVQHRVAVGLGSNLGDRVANLRFGLCSLRPILEGMRVTRIYETVPLGYVNQPHFLNACCVGWTRLTPLQLLSKLQDAERMAGRGSGGPRFGPRELDLDLLLHGEQTLESDRLILPHPRIRERGFVLVPLAEIAADWTVPAAAEWDAATVAELAAAVDRSGIARTELELCCQ